MHKAAITFRHLQPTAADLSVANQILGDAFNRHGNRWDTELRLYLTIEPEGFVLAYDADKPVAVGGAINWGTFAYIGMVGVVHTHQGRGVGAQLMQQLLDKLDRLGCPIAALDATAAGEPLYGKLGFVAEDQRLVMLRPASLPLPTRPIVSPHDKSSEDKLAENIDLAPITSADVPALLDYDAPIFGADRQRLLRELFARCQITVGSHGMHKG